MEQELCLKEGKVSRKESRRFRMDGPDGGWAWAVAFAACVISFIMAGLGRMSGILYVAFIEWCGSDRRAASAPFSIRASVRNLLGPVVGILGQKYGVRLVTICGGVLATLSASLCFFAPDIIWITVLWGALNGVGAALTVTLPQVIVGQYFEKYTTTATGMAFSGGCIGAFLFPVLLEQLLYEYGMQGTFLVIGAIIMHTIPAAMILRKPPWMKKNGQTRNNNEEGTDCLCESSSVREELLKNGESEDVIGNGKAKVMPKIENGMTKSSTKDFPDVKYLRDHKSTVLRILTMKTSMDCFLSVSSTTTPSEAKMDKELDDLLTKIHTVQRKVRFSNVLRAFKRKEPPLPINKSLGEQKSQSFQFAITSEFDMCDVYKTCSVPDIFREARKPNYVAQKLKDVRECPSDIISRFPEKDIEEVTRILSELGKVHDAITLIDGGGSSEEDQDIAGVTLPTTLPSNTFLSHLGTAFRLHGNPLFLLICICRSVHFITLVPVMTIIVDFLMDKGLREEDGKWGIAVLSLGDLIGRIGFGWVTDGGYLSLAKYMLLAMVLQGVSTASLALMEGKVALYAMLWMFGLLQGTLFVRHNVLVTKYMDDDEQSIAMGCMNFFSGVLGFGLPAYIGYFRDTLGTYSYIFYINGGINFLTGLLWALEPYLLSCSAPKPKAVEMPTPV